MDKHLDTATAKKDRKSDRDRGRKRERKDQKVGVEQRRCGAKKVWSKQLRRVVIRLMRHVVIRLMPTP